MSADFQPFTFVNTQGEPAGMFVDIWRLWSQKTGRPISFLVSDWQTSLDNLRTGKADVHSGLVHSPQRTGWLAQIPPFYPTDIRYFQLRRQVPLEDVSQLADATVAVLKGGAPEEYLRTNYPDIRLLGVDNRDDLLAAVRTGRAKGFALVAPVASALIDRHGLSGEFEKNGMVLYGEEFSPGVLKENAALAVLVSHGLEAITPKEWASIEAAWIEDPAKRRFQPDTPLLTDEERRWVAAHPAIRVGMSPVLPPLKFTEDGAIIKGVEPDYLEEIAERTGLKFEYVVCPFSEMDAKVRAGELDMFLSFYIPSRLESMNFTNPFMDFKQLLVARSETPYFGSLAALNGKRVATVKGVKLHEKVLAPHPGIQVVPCDTMEEMFRAVVAGRADALISKTLFAGYMLERFPQLKIAGVLDLPPEPYLYAVRKDYPELISILNKGIAAIPPARLDAIVQKWFTLHIEYQPQAAEILRWVALTATLCAVVGGVAVMLLWNRQLRRRVALNTDERLNRQKQDLLRLNEIIVLSGMGAASDQAVYDRILDTIVRLTDSQYGYVYFYDETTELFTLHAWSEQVTADCLVIDPQTEYSLQKTGFWGEVVRQRRSIINNDFAAPHPLKKGYPDGHAPVTRFMSVPVLSGERIVAVAGVANKARPYDAEDALVLQEFCQGAWNVMSQRREHRQYLDEQLRYQQLFETMPAPCANHEIIFDKQGEPCDYRFLLVNQSFAELLGRSREEIVGWTARELTSANPPPLLDRYATVAMKGTNDEFEYFVAATGKTLMIRCYSPRENTVVAIARDVTADRLLLEQNLRDAIERQERLRFSRDLHDSAGQTFQTIRLYLNLIEDGKVPVAELPQVAARLDEEVAEAFAELREIAHQLRPDFLQNNHLDGAIAIRCERLRKRGLPVVCACFGDATTIPINVSENLYRIFQEALTNAAFHAAATSIEVTLDCRGLRVCLTIRDNGRGLGDRRGGVGLQTMNERAKMIHAHFALESTTAGTSVTVEWEKK